MQEGERGRIEGLCRWLGKVLGLGLPPNCSLGENEGEGVSSGCGHSHITALALPVTITPFWKLPIMEISPHCWLREPSFFKIDFKERERGRERNICCSTHGCTHWLIPTSALTGDRTQTLASQYDAPTKRATWVGGASLKFFLIKNFFSLWF